MRFKRALAFCQSANLKAPSRIRPVGPQSGLELNERIQPRVICGKSAPALLGFSHLLSDIVPVDQLADESIDIVWTAILEVKIVGVLPDIHR